MSLLSSLILAAAVAKAPTAWVESCKGVEAGTNSWNTYKALSAAVDLEWKNDLGLCTKLENALEKSQVIDLRNEEIKDLTPVFRFENVTRLLASGNEIESLTGIEQLKKLEVLDLGNNMIEDIKPISLLKNLTQLRVAKNHIKDINPLFAMQQLEKLSLAYNRLQDIDGISRLQNLSYLSLASNELKEIKTLRVLSNLQVLNLSFNAVCAQSQFDGFANKSIKIIGRDNQKCKDRPS